MRKTFGRILVVLMFFVVAASWVRGAAGFQRTQDVLYGRKHGMALTLDVFQPAQTNGYGLIFMVSGGFYSDHAMIQPALVQSFLDRGYTVFAVVHGSQPKYTIPEIVEDIHRAVRFIRHHASLYGVRGDRLGITGASAGGHLSLTMGVHGGPGKPDARDPVDADSSAVQAIACFFPPTDFLNYGKPGEDAVGVGVLKDFQAAFGPRASTPEGRQKLGYEISPLNFVSSNLPPTLIAHGDADTLVPIQQAEVFVERARKVGATAELIVKPGGAHGWPDLGKELERFGDWFDLHLRGIRPTKAQP